MDNEHLHKRWEILAQVVPHYNVYGTLYRVQTTFANETENMSFGSPKMMYCSRLFVMHT